MIDFNEWLIRESKELVANSVLQSYERAFRGGLDKLIQRTQDPRLKARFKDMLDCPIVDRRGHCRGFAEYVLGALIRNGIHHSYDIEAALSYVFEKMMMDRSLETGQPRLTVFDDFDETRPYNAGENPLQARFMSWLHFAVKNIRKGAIRRLSNVERRPAGTVSITPGRWRKGDSVGGLSAEQIPGRTYQDEGLNDLVNDISALLAAKEATSGRPWVDMFREMMAGMRTKESRERFGDRRSRRGRQVIIRTVEEYARSSGNQALLRLLQRLKAEESETPPAPASPGTPKPKPTNQQRDYASIIAVVDKLGRPVGSADLGKYRRRWLDYPPRNPLSGHRNRLEEVLEKMVKDGVLRATPTRQGAIVYSLGPHADAYRQGATV